MLLLTERGALHKPVLYLSHCFKILTLLRLIARGEKETAAGKGFELDTVLADADAILGEATK